jgi:hypothetical protein
VQPRSLPNSPGGCPQDRGRRHREWECGEVFGARINVTINININVSNNINNININNININININTAACAHADTHDSCTHKHQASHNCSINTRTQTTESIRCPGHQSQHPETPDCAYRALYQTTGCCFGRPARGRRRQSRGARPGERSETSTLDIQP